MALRDQPYIPLYVNDFLTDEKLCECSAESTGVYIRLMCILHKSERYGTLTLTEKDKKFCRGKTSSKVLSFARKLAKQMPYSVEVIESSLEELSEEKVISVDGDTLFQKRMVKDGELSVKRAIAGSRGGKNTAKANKQNLNKNKNFACNFAEAKTAANSENETETENETENEYENELKEENGSKKIIDPLAEIIAYFEGATGRTASRTMAEETGDFLSGGTEAELICAVIDYATDSDSGNWNYIRAVLNNLEAEGVRTFADYKKSREAFRETRRQGMKTPPPVARKSAFNNYTDENKIDYSKITNDFLNDPI